MHKKSAFAGAISVAVMTYSDGSRRKHSELQRLSPHQLNALLHVEQIAQVELPSAREGIEAILDRAELTRGALDDAVEAIRNHARVVLHFHPDRLGFKKVAVAQSLLEDGCYRNQFETGLSSGSLTAFPGGDRDQWEECLFGGAYHGTGVSAADRPKYGALELIRHADGPSPRFGSCYFILRPSVAKRCSFTFGGSQSPQVLQHSGTTNIMECFIVALLVEIQKGDGSMGVRDLTVERLFKYLTNELPRSYPAPSDLQLGRSLDSFIEAQIHGVVDLNVDIERLVADPAFRGTKTGEHLEAICSKYKISMFWHPGFRLHVSQVPDNFRGPAMPPLARRIARDGVLNVAVIGEAAASLNLHPDLWRDSASYEETLQHLKQLWHVLVQYGTPIRADDENPPAVR